MRNSYTCLSLLLVTGCLCAQENILDPNAGQCLNGYSGMANIDGNTYLVVHDKKPHHPGDRLSIIRTTGEYNFTITQVPVADWKHADGPSSDLEGVCKIPGRTNEFLAIESGQWDGKFGRLFHLALDLSAPSPAARVVHAYDLPVFDPKGPGDPGDEFEGLECAAITADKTLLIIGERGGSAAWDNGKLRWATLDLNNKVIEWTAAGKSGKTVDAPGAWVDSSKNRDITALHLDENQVLWATASEDAGDTGPFKSLLYRVGTVAATRPDPIQLASNYAVTRRSDGLKIEALAGPSDVIPQSAYAIGTEDECFGGVWRPLK